MVMKHIEFVAFVGSTYTSTELATQSLLVPHTPNFEVNNSNLAHLPIIPRSKAISLQRTG